MSVWQPSPSSQQNITDFNFRESATFVFRTSSLRSRRWSPFSRLLPLSSLSLSSALSLSLSLGGAYLLWPLSSSREGGRKPKESTGCHSTLIIGDVTFALRGLLGLLPLSHHSHKSPRTTFTRTQCSFSWNRSAAALHPLSPLPPHRIQWYPLAAA